MKETTWYPQENLKNMLVMLDQIYNNYCDLIHRVANYNATCEDLKQKNDHFVRQLEVLQQMEPIYRSLTLRPVAK